MKAYLLVLMLALVFTGCDLLGLDNESGDESLELTASNRVTMKAGGLTVDVDSSGALHEMELLWGGQQISTVYSGGLWLAGKQGGKTRFSGTALRSTMGNLVSETGGVYLLTADSLKVNITDWPVDKGAPVDAQGQPRLYGDVMAWTSLTSRPFQNAFFPDLFNSPFKNLQVSQTAYAFSSGNLKDVLFVRYEITNRSSETMTDMYVGVSVDTDLSASSAKQGCSLPLFNNATGYDAAGGISYTYHAQFQKDANPNDCSVPVTGFSLLETPAQGPSRSGVGSHRLLYKSKFNQDYSELTFLAPINAYFVLQGLTNRGETMINPVSEQATLFALNGDPVAGTGWIDETGGSDVRALLNGNTFTLAPDEKKVFTAIFAYGEGNSLSAALGNLKAKINAAVAAPL